MTTIKLFGHQEIAEFIEGTPELTTTQLRDILEAYTSGTLTFVKIRPKGAPKETPQQRENARNSVLSWLRKHGPRIDTGEHYVPSALILTGENLPVWGHVKASNRISK